MTASDEIAMNENFNAANKSSWMRFSRCVKRRKSTTFLMGEGHTKLRKLDKNALNAAMMPERRSAFNKYKVKLSSNAAEKAVGTTKTTKESKLEREKIAENANAKYQKKRDD